MFNLPCQPWETVSANALPADSGLVFVPSVDIDRRQVLILMQTLKMRSFARSTTPFVDWPCQYDMLPYLRYFHKGRIKPAFMSVRYYPFSAPVCLLFSGLYGSRRRRIYSKWLKHSVCLTAHAIVWSVIPSSGSQNPR